MHTWINGSLESISKVQVGRIRLFEPSHLCCNLAIKKPAKPLQGQREKVKNGNKFNFEGKDKIEFSDKDSTLYAFFPRDFAVSVGDSVLTGKEPVLRLFYTERGKHFFAAGIPYAWLETAQAGDIIIDPTVATGATQDVHIENTSNQDGHIDGLKIGALNLDLAKRILIKFDLLGAGIPANANVVSARLKLKYHESFTNSATWVDRDVGAHQMLVDWKPAETDLIERLTGVSWGVAFGQAGTDYTAMSESNVLFTQSTFAPSWQSWDLTALTQQWLDGTANHGVMLINELSEGTPGYELRFHSTESAPSLLDQPYLEVEWTVPQHTLYYLKDHLGSIRATVDDIGQLVSYDDYDPWGMTLAGRSMTAQANLPNKFTGKERDTDFGLDWDYFGARYYDPVIGRWLVGDPILGKETQAFLLANGLLGVSPYNYAFNRPTVLTDPDGECPACLGAGIGLLIGGGFEFIKQANGGSFTNFSNFSLNRDFDGSKIVGAAVEGLITGAVAGATGGTFLVTSVVANSAAGVVGGATKRAITGQNVAAPGAIVTDAVAGGLGGAAANLAEGLVASGAAETVSRTVANRVVSKVVQKTVQKLPSAARSVSKTVVRKTSEKIQEIITPKENDQDK